MAAKTATTSSNVNLREGPGTNFNVVTLLPNRTTVTIISESSEWIKVSANNQSGFIHRSFIVLPEQKIATGFLMQHPTAYQWALKPTQILSTPTDADPKSKQVIKIWNQFGGILQRLSERLKIDFRAAVAVVAVESSGSGFLNNRLIIRFENHYFWRLWGMNNAEKFNRYFGFDSAQPWVNHQFRADKNLPFQNFHGSQDGEWKVFTQAKNLNDEAAKRSISMGLPQIMGANYKLIGYESAGQMFTAFSKDERTQILGLFDFIQGPESFSRKITALQDLDFVAFAEQYNGPGQAAEYGGKLRFYFELMKLFR